MKRPATFADAAEGIVETGASVDERRIVSMLAEHAAAEQTLLERYQRFADEAASPAARYLVRMILEDEERHHRLLAEMANAVAWEGSDLSPTETVPELEVDGDGALARETKWLLDAELGDRRELRRLHRQLAPYQQTTLWGLLVELMELDTEKHVHILRFVARHCR